MSAQSQITSFGLAKRAKDLGCTPGEISESTTYFGPFYNTVSDNGLPVLGDWIQPSTTIDTVNFGRTSLYDRIYTPTVGVLTCSHFLYQQQLESEIAYR